MFKIKRGSTFKQVGELDITIDGVAVTDLTGYVMTSHVRTRDRQSCHEDVGDLTVSNPSGISVTLEGETETWPLGVLIFDIRVETPSGDVIYTPTVQFECVREITPWA